MTTRPVAPARGPSDVEADLEDITVHYFVLLAFDPQLADVASGRPRAQLEQLVPVHDLRTDKATLEVGMDDAGALRRLGARPERPGPALFVPGGEKGTPAEQTVGSLSHPG